MSVIDEIRQIFERGEAENAEKFAESIIFNEQSSVSDRGTALNFLFNYYSDNKLHEKSHSLATRAFNLDLGTNVLTRVVHIMNKVYIKNFEFDKAEEMLQTLLSRRSSSAIRSFITYSQKLINALRETTYDFVTREQYVDLLIEKGDFHFARKILDASLADSSIKPFMRDICRNQKLKLECADNNYDVAFQLAHIFLEEGYSNKNKANSAHDYIDMCMKAFRRGRASAPSKSSSQSKSYVSSKSYAPAKSPTPSESPKSPVLVISPSDLMRVR